MACRALRSVIRDTTRYRVGHLSYIASEIKKQAIDEQAIIYLLEGLNITKNRVLIKY